MTDRKQNVSKEYFNIGTVWIKSNSFMTHDLLKADQTSLEFVF